MARRYRYLATTVSDGTAALHLSPALVTANHLEWRPGQHVHLWPPAPTPNRDSSGTTAVSIRRSIATTSTEIATLECTTDCQIDGSPALQRARGWKTHPCSSPEGAVKVESDELWQRRHAAASAGTVLHGPLRAPDHRGLCLASLWYVPPPATLGHVDCGRPRDGRSDTGGQVDPSNSNKSGNTFSFLM